jgi:hypothetical protein
VTQRALWESSKDSNGERETKEHRGRVRGVSNKLTWKEGFLERKSVYQKRKMISRLQIDVEELKIQLKMKVLGDLRPIL